jgi:IS5 family transposase
LEVTVRRETDPQPSLWEVLLPEQAKRLPAELATIDAYLDDECFIGPWRRMFDQRLGRPSVPIDTLLRLLYLKHRYGLGYESCPGSSADVVSGTGSYVGSRASKSHSRAPPPSEGLRRSLSR